MKDFIEEKLEEFDKKFEHSEVCSCFKYKDKEPSAYCYCQLKEIKNFLDQALTQVQNQAFEEGFNSGQLQQKYDVSHWINIGQKMGYIKYLKTKIPDLLK